MYTAEDFIDTLAHCYFVFIMGLATVFMHALFTKPVDGSKATAGSCDCCGCNR